MSQHDPYRSDAIVLHRAQWEALRAQAARAAEAVELLQRTRADFLNYQDRARREREEALRYGAEEFLREFLPALDSLRESVAMAEKAGASPGVVEGLRLLEREFHRALAKCGVERIEPEGRPFDPAEHQAIGTVEVEDGRDGIVVEVVRAGYRYRDRVLRAALVRVGERRAAGACAGENRKDAGS
jgi:molecular chaperone GrpE